MRIAVCDDEFAVRENIAGMLRNYEIHRLDISLFCSGDDLLEEYKNGESFDVIFLDIEMPGLSGIETGKAIRQMDNDAIICFLTGYEHYVFRAVKIGIFDYLVKPVSLEMLKEVLQRILKKYENENYKLCLPGENRTEVVNTKEIYYIEGYRRKLFFYTTRGIIETRGKLNELENELSDRGFLRCHQGFLVNMRHVTGIGEKHLLLPKEHKAEISARKTTHCFKALNQYLGRKM